MRMQLAGWCVLLAVAGSFAADKPKKGKPTTQPPASGAVVGPLGGGLVGPLTGPDVDRGDTKFTITKPVGTWVRDAEKRFQVCLTITDDRLTLQIKTKLAPNTGSIRVEADYAINKESCLFGVIDSYEEDQSNSAHKQQMPGQPFCVRFRVEGDTLTLKEFKGLGVGIEPFTDREAEALAVVCGKYTQFETSKKEKVQYNSDPLLRQDQLLNQSETFGQPGAPVHTHQPAAPAPQRIFGGIMPTVPPNSIPHIGQDDRQDQSEDLRAIGEVWRRFWFNDQPSHLTPQRIRGGILKADPPKDEPNDSNTRILPPLKKGEKPACVVAPSDAEVMRVFNDRRQQEVGKDFELAQDDIVIVKNIVKDKISPPRFYPIVGMAQLHEVSWECGVYYYDTTDGKRKPKVEVITIGKDHLHLYVGVNPDALRDALLEMTKWR